MWLIYKPEIWPELIRYLINPATKKEKKHKQSNSKRWRNLGKVTSVTSEDLRMILLSPEKNCDHSNTLDKQGKQETDDVQHRGTIKETYDWVTRDKSRWQKSSGHIKSSMSPVWKHWIMNLTNLLLIFKEPHWDIEFPNASEPKQHRWMLSSLVVLLVPTFSVHSWDVIRRKLANFTKWTGKSLETKEQFLVWMRKKSHCKWADYAEACQV